MFPRVLEHRCQVLLRIDFTARRFGQQSNLLVDRGVALEGLATMGAQSGLGREGSKYGLEEYLEVKYVLIGGIQ